VVMFIYSVLQSHDLVDSASALFEARLE